MCADCNQYVEQVNHIVADECEIKLFDCTMCRNYLPCQKASGKTDDIICEKFDNLYPEDDEEMSLEQLQELANSIPDDPIELPEDYENLPEE